MPFRGWQKTRIPLVEKAQEDVAAAILPTGVFRSLRNMRFEVAGKLRARNRYAVVAGTTGFDDTGFEGDPFGSGFVDNEPLATPHRLYELGGVQLASDGQLRARDATSGRYASLGALRPLQMLPPRQITTSAAVATANYLQSRTMAHCAGYTAYAWIGGGSGTPSARRIYALVVDEATGARLSAEILIVDDINLGSPVLVASSRYMYLFYSASTSIEVYRFDTQAPESGFQVFSTATSESNSKHFDVAYTTVGGEDRIVLAFDKDDGAGVEGLGIEMFDEDMSGVASAEVDYDSNIQAVSVLAAPGDANIWIAYAVDDASGTFLDLWSTSLVQNFAFPTQLTSSTAVYTGLSYVADANAVLVAWQTTVGAATSDNDIYGQFSAGIFNSSAALIQQFASARDGFTMTAQPYKLDDMVVQPVMLRHGAGTPDRIVEALVALTSDTASGWRIVAHHTPALMCAFARGQASPDVEATGTLAKVVNIGNSAFAYPRHVHLLQEDADTAAIIALRDYRWRYTDDPLLHETQLSAGYNSGLYFSGALTSFTDGTVSIEVGFPLKTEMTATHVALSASGGAIAGGSASHVYQYVTLQEWMDANGVRHQGPPSDPLPVDFSASAYAAGSNTAVFSIRQPVTAATYLEKRRHAVYRTEHGPQEVFYRTTDASTASYPAAVPGGGVIPFRDEVSDEDLADNEISYLTIGHLNHEMPPPTHHIVVHGDRLCAIDAEDRERIVFSAPRVLGEAAIWNSVWQQKIEGYGPLTALASLDGKLYGFTASSVHAALWGSGPSVTNQGGQFEPPQLLSRGAGCRDPRSVVVSSDGIYFAGDFENQTMIFCWPRGDGAPLTVGDPIRDTLQSFPNITSAVRLEKESQLRWTAVNDAKTASVVLVYDYSMRDRQGNGYWYVWDVSGVVLHAEAWDGIHTMIVDASGTVSIQREGTEPYNGTALATLGHMWPAGIMTPARLKAINVHGEALSVSSASAKPQLTVGVSYDGGRSFVTRAYPVDASAAGVQFTKRCEPRQQRLTNGDVVVQLGLATGGAGTENLALHAMMVEWNPDGDGPRLGSGHRK